jgi:hypothetical protein
VQWGERRTFLPARGGQSGGRDERDTRERHHQRM